MAGSMFYLAPVENASGKIFGKKEKFVAVRRTWGKRQRGCSAMGERDLINHPLTDAEQAQRAKFGAVSKATTARMKDPTKVAEDQLAFRKQSEYKTLRQYVWHQCEAEYAAANE